MFEQKDDVNNNKKDILNNNNKYKNIINSITQLSYQEESVSVDALLELEKHHNKSEQWNKLDKNIKIQKLHQYAEKYGKDNNLPVKDIKSLKMFFLSCLDNNKLQKTKDVLYDKLRQEINAIPALYFNQQNRNFTLKIVDAKRISTLKSLTPKRITGKNQDEENIGTAVYTSPLK
uniref:Uncharacterized protein n=1 Tax=viral metagenome TaxID=1070528 RepID=A0A6C0JMC9_9ZZZZ